MRTSKVITVSVPPKFEHEIQKHAQYEHRTVSEYIREAVRKYMVLQEFETTQKAVSKRMKKRGLKPKDVESALSGLRPRA
jgi:Arc/MetJ-type ribon-helix-helix transcriptional regulator